MFSFVTNKKRAKSALYYRAITGAMKLIRMLSSIYKKIIEL